jgi:hypothetical protein
MKLAPAGAGLPEVERLGIEKILVPIARTLFTWDLALFMVKREVRIINKLLENISLEQRREQNIISRTFAIEDDTRRYSINMALDHLLVAGNAVMLVIKTLSSEKSFDREVTIEGVKAQHNEDNALEKFNDFYAKYANFITSIPHNQSKATKKHPWFVYFNNFDWSVFMFMHTMIHRRQIEEIIKTLGAKNV